MRRAPSGKLKPNAKKLAAAFASIPRHFSVGEQNAKIKCGEKCGQKNAARASHPSRIHT
jgi:hypothetical protein